MIDIPAGTGQLMKLAGFDMLQIGPYCCAKPTVTVAQLVRAPGCDPGGWGFESPRSPFSTRPPSGSTSPKNNILVNITGPQPDTRMLA